MEYVALILATLVAIYNVYDRLTRVSATSHDVSHLATKSDLSQIKPGPSWEKIKDYIDQYFATQEWVTQYFVRTPPPPTGSKVPMLPLPPPAPAPGPTAEEIKILRERSSRAIMAARELFTFVSHVIRTFQERFKAPLEAEKAAILLQLRQKLQPLEDAKKACERKLLALQASPMQEHPSDEQLEAELRQACQHIPSLTERIDAHKAYLAGRHSKWQAYLVDVLGTEELVRESNLALETFQQSAECKAFEAQISELNAHLAKFDALDEDRKKVGQKLSKSAESIPPSEVTEVASELESLRRSFPPPPPPPRP